MSGTSLDGIDIAFCSFQKNDNWTFDIINAITYPYPDQWKEALCNAEKLDAFNFIKLHKDYGKFIGESVNRFLNGEKVDFIASHGHTIFHQPDKNITFQIGDGATIAAATGITTISDFRNLDVVLGGQGAPLVPIGDQLLFSEYDYCINLGGFANLSYNENGTRLAYDICPYNIIVNQLTRTINKEFDKDGELGRQGNLNTELLNRLNSIAYYSQPAPKSLGKEWLNVEFAPYINKSDLCLNDKIRTIYEHIAIQLNEATQSATSKKVLITGGGTYNQFVIERFQQLTKHQLVMPDNNIIDFKEALIFAFLGVLRYREKVNCLASVTGAKHDNIGGVIHKL